MPEPIPADRLSDAMDALHWGSKAVAYELGMDDRMIRRWLKGQDVPPETDLAWLESLAALLRAYRPPGRS